MATTCDPMVYELAASFLEKGQHEGELWPAGQRDRVMSLACAIQQAAEDWIESERIDRERQAAEASARDEELRSLRGYDPQEIAEKF